MKVEDEMPASESEQRRPKNIHRKMFALFVIFNAVTVVAIFLSFSRNSPGNVAFLAAILFVLLWPILSYFVKLYYARTHGNTIGQSVFLLLGGPYVLIVGVLIVISILQSGRGVPVEKVTYFGGSRPTVTEIHYSNDENWIVLLVALAVIIGGAAIWKTGADRLAKKSVKSEEHTSQDT